MRVRPKPLTVWLRSLAACALWVFATAQSACFIHCHWGSGPENADTPPPCHRAASCHKSPQDRETPPLPPSPTCSTLKTMLAWADSPLVNALQTLPLDQPAPTSLAIHPPHSTPLDAFFRQGRSREWVFTPEVCLGPAFRSLAPPRFA